MRSSLDTSSSARIMGEKEEGEGKKGGKERGREKEEEVKRNHEMCMYCLHSYLTAHIWACPPSEGDDYIFHCHPMEQKIPKPKRLIDWYRKMLDSGKSTGVVCDYRVGGRREGREMGGVVGH